MTIRGGGGERLLIFFISGIVAIIAYFISISIYSFLSKDPIFFIASSIFSIFIPILICTAIFKIFPNLFDVFSIFLMMIVYFLGLISVSVFGPIFIDRSISYHIVFLAYEEKSIDIEKIEKAMSENIFQKRVHDAIKSGYLLENKDGSYSPTLKTAIMYKILHPIGKVTRTLGTYKDMKNQIYGQNIYE